MHITKANIQQTLSGVVLIRAALSTKLDQAPGRYPQGAWKPKNKNKTQTQTYPD